MVDACVTDRSSISAPLRYANPTPLPAAIRGIRRAKSWLSMNNEYDDDLVGIQLT